MKKALLIAAGAVVIAVVVVRLLDTPSRDIWDQVLDEV